LSTPTQYPLFDLATKAENNNEFEAADKLYQQALRNNQNNTNIIQKYAHLKEKIGQHQASLELITKAVKLDPKNVSILNSQGNILHRMGRFEEARLTLLKALEIKAKDYLTLINLSNVLAKLNMHDARITRIKQALEIKPDYGDAWHLLSELHFLQGDLKQALQAIEKALTLSPNNVKNLCQLGKVLFNLHKFDQAESIFLNAISIDTYNDTAHRLLALVYLMTGRFHEGWQQYEWRCHSLFGTKLPLERLYRNKPIWRGEPIKNKILLVWNEQGFGDAIFISRYILLIEETYQPKKIIFVCKEPQVKLFKQSFPRVEIIEPNTTSINFNHHCPMMSLMSIFKTDDNNIPSKTPYLKVKKTDAHVWVDRLPKTEYPLIGLCWAGSPATPSDKLRSINLDALKPLLNLPLTFISLQIDARKQDIKQHQLNDKIVDLSDNIKNFYDTAALITNLDLIISVDTAVGHLAGALNKPVWTLHRHVPHWLWQLNTSKSPWYPSMQLFRQNKSADWNPVIQDVKNQLMEYFEM